jgi:hypothetical protein
MVALAATNAVGVILFGTLYAFAGARRLPQLAFMSCLLIVFALVTALWVRTEARHRALHPLRRLGRAMVGLVAVIVVTPAAVLMPLFWLEGVLPAEAGMAAALGPIMALVLISLALVMLTNIVGALVIAGRAALAGGAR